MEKKTMEKKTLVVVDMQNDFIDGVFANPEAQKIVPKVAEYIRNWNGKVVYTMDTHHVSVGGLIEAKVGYKDSIEGQRLPAHCMMYTKGWCLNEEIIAAKDSRDDSGRFPYYTPVITKESFGSLSLEHHVKFAVTKTSPDNCEYYDYEDPEEIVLVGLCTDICVISNALILRAEYPKVPIKVIASMCAGTTKENHEAALKVMRSCCIDVEE